MSNLTKTVLSVGLVIIIIGSLVGGSFTAEAVNQHRSSKLNKGLSKVYLYQKPSKKSPYVSLDMSTSLIKIYKQGDWVKVGDQLDGKIGWINNKQYNLAHQAWQAQLKSDYQITETRVVSGKTIEVTEGQKNGVRYMIVARKNLQNTIGNQSVNLD
ncbi:hypothetical protein L3V82_05770 [Thiotrichales bacterium 19S3-7]|nr:hypothetical protein [Thiotrichales bacterium 19S3-7]MCF6801602.1 hypothetical protein [Thiotrichales bacterium 19S3-11]